MVYFDANIQYNETFSYILYTHTHTQANSKRYQISHWTRKHFKHWIQIDKVNKTKKKTNQKQNYRYLGSWSASTSPARSPSPSRYGHAPRGKPGKYPAEYGTTSLCQRSRSPSPARLQEMRERGRLVYDERRGTVYIYQKFKILKEKKIQKKTFKYFSLDFTLSLQSSLSSLSLLYLFNSFFLSLFSSFSFTFFLFLFCPFNFSK